MIILSEECIKSSLVRKVGCVAVSKMPFSDLEQRNMRNFIYEQVGRNQIMDVFNLSIMVEDGPTYQQFVKIYI